LGAQRLLRWLLGASHLSLAVNSSINPLIYFSVGRRFKEAAYRLNLHFCKRLSGGGVKGDQAVETELTEVGSVIDRRGAGRRGTGRRGRLSK
jgi:hypothetical protein